MRRLSQRAPTSLLPLIVAGVAACGGACPARASITLQKVVTTGEVMPQSAGAIFSVINSATINVQGKVAVKVQMSGPGFDSGTDDMIWLWADGKKSVLVGERFSAAGIWMNEIGTFPRITDSGGVVFAVETGASTSGSTSEGAICFREGSNFSVLLRDGPHPSLEEGRRIEIGPVRTPTFVVSGDAVGVSTLTYDGSKTGGALWSLEPTGARLVMASGRHAPGTPDGVLFKNTGYAYGAINCHTRSLKGTLEGTGVSASNDTGIWLEDANGLGLVVREGDATAVSGRPCRYGEINSPRLNDEGELVFISEVVDLETNAATGVIWSGFPGDLRPVVTDGQHTAELPDGVVFRVARNANYSPPFNNSAQMLFSSSVTGPNVDTLNDQCLWLFDPTAGLDLVVREGDAVPGIPGAEFSNITEMYRFNALGQVLAVFGERQGDYGAVTRALYAYETTTGLQRLFAVGDTLNWEGGSGVLSEVSAMSFSTGPHAALTLSFRDGMKGVFVLTVPEPGSAVALACALIGMGHRRGFRGRRG